MIGNLRPAAGLCLSIRYAKNLIRDVSLTFTLYTLRTLLHRWVVQNKKNHISNMILSSLCTKLFLIIAFRIIIVIFIIRLLCSYSMFVPGSSVDNSHEIMLLIQAKL